jgi:hypothetical protein
VQFPVSSTSAIISADGGDQGAFACTLGGPGERSLYILTAPGSHPEQCRAARGGRVEVIDAQYRRAGSP